MQCYQALLSTSTQANARVAAGALASLLEDDDVRLCITHGNGPQVGLLAGETLLFSPALGEFPKRSLLHQTPQQSKTPRPPSTSWARKLRDKLAMSWSWSCNRHCRIANCVRC